MTVLALSVGLALAPIVSCAAGAPVAPVSRPLYLEVSTNADDTVLPATLVEAMARETLSSAKRAVIGLDPGQPAPDGVQVLRVMVLVSDHQDETGAVYAATAATSLFTTPDAGRTVSALYYQGLQQELITAPQRDEAATTLRARFKADLAKRVRSALAALAR